MSNKITFPVEAGAIMLFARACGDHSDKFQGDDCVAPPTFVQSSAQYDPDYFLRPQPDKEWFGSGKNATGITKKSDSGGGSMAGTLHAEQRYEFIRPVRAGEKLYATVSPGKSWSKEGRRGGMLKFSESVTEFRDEDGNLVVIATGLGVVTEKVIDS